ncbi:MAG: adenylyltransferase/cytidyltransferase family protein [Lentisphaeria bacterium]|nr:adenylyltransferase/cytidyltransferase family protein [Lentisphaeria bacterium]MDD6338205.1 adenylyltransferase/cytidyltransferase family protein [Lentisphaeria bacterium]
MDSPRSLVMTLEEAVEARRKLAASGRKLAVTNGCFDLLHRGHAEYLMQARSLADALFVLVNSDASVRALKGPTRPVNAELDRAFLLACLKFVDGVVIFRSSRCDAELAALKPDVYVKGGDYTVESLDPSERSALLASGADIRFIPFVPGYSTTGTLKKAGQGG